MPTKAALYHAGESGRGLLLDLAVQALAVDPHSGPMLEIGGAGTWAGSTLTTYGARTWVSP